MSEAAQNLERLDELRRALGPNLVAVDRVAPRPGLPTGWAALDQFTLWRGLPKGALTLFHGAAGLGATSLWTQAAAQVTAQGRWAVWIEGAGSRLNPWPLRRMGVRLERLLVIAGTRDLEQRLWALQEVLSLSLFDLVGCELDQQQLKIHQVVKLKNLAHRAQSAVVLLSRRDHASSRSHFALVNQFRGPQVAVERALHRTTPHILPRRDTYADLMPQLTQGRTPRHRRIVSHL